MVCRLNLLFPYSSLGYFCPVTIHTTQDCHRSWNQGLERKREEVREIFSGDKRERGFSEQPSGYVEGGFKSIRRYLLVECSQMGGPNSIQCKPQTIAGWGWGNPWGGPLGGAGPLTPSPQSSALCEMKPTILVPCSLQRTIVTLH